jgi:DNA mismatch repair protein PMS2
MVLSTAGASWNLRRDVDVDVEPPRKKSRVFSEAENAANTNVCGKEKGNEGRGARQNLRSRLSLFARNGSQVVVDDLEDEEAVEPDGEVEVEVDELQEEDEPTNFSRPREKTGCNREDDGDMDLDVRPGDVIRNKPEVPTAIDGDIDDVPRVITGRAIKMESELIDFTRDNGHDSSRDITMLDAAASVSDKQSQRSGESVSRPEIVRSADGESVSMRFDLFKVSETWRQIRDKLSYISPAFDPDAELKSSIGQDAGVSNLEDDERAADALSRVIDKEDFGSMEITGQFNLGFIVTRRRKAIDKEGRADMDDLFIVDQHAADEKYNFETLQQTTRIKSQKLFRSVRIWTVGEMSDID